MGKFKNSADGRASLIPIFQRFSRPSFVSQALEFESGAVLHADRPAF